MAYSNISVTLDQAQLNQILTQVKALKTSLSFLVGLTPDEKKKMRKMGDKLTSYVCYGFLKYAARNNPSLGESVKLLGARFKRTKLAPKAEVPILQ